ncbi:MAG: hypothetical protein HN793_02780 [Rhodospirillaceae bacterium]|nr:hypothetical protein [Rhodospirillaceae bacterium]MBT5564415.1 hypothetical protein [Rhodospirillaceae bacterium]MBT6089706.1 hypothetical protein [Rhodospirillaceae bacterium]MBT7449729.1 hypothetical protein [Rhodospirillaceae bacterium]
MTLSLKQKGVGLGALAAAIIIGAWLFFTRWTPEDAANAQHYHQAMLEVREAIAYANGKGGLIDPSDARYLIERYNQAAQQADLVRDEVLSKLHSELPEAWHDLFVPSTQIYRRAFEDQDRDLARQASLIQDDWVRWLRLNGHQVKVPPPPSNRP